MSLPSPHRRALALVALAAAGALVLAACSSSPPATVVERGEHVARQAAARRHDDNGVPGASALTAIGPIPAADLSPAGTAGTGADGDGPHGAPARPAWRARISSWAPAGRRHRVTR